MKKPLIAFCFTLLAFCVSAQLQYSRITVYDSIKLNGKSVTGISNDSTAASKDSNRLITEYAAKRYADNNKTDTTSLSNRINTKEPLIPYGTTSQYWRGDKTWQNLATVATTGSYNDLLNKPTLTTSLSNLTDVSLSGLTSGQLLQYNGTSWQNWTPNFINTSKYSTDSTATAAAITANTTQLNTHTSLINSLIADSALQALQIANLKTSKQDVLGFEPEDASMKNEPDGYAGLDINGKVPTSLLPASVLGTMKYIGTWNASGGTYPASPVQGNYWVINTAGTLGGIPYQTGDWLVYNSSSWDIIHNQQTVTSVAGKVGAVMLTTDDITEGTNQFFTAARARSALTLTTTGTGGAATYNSSTGAFNIPNYTLAGLGGIGLTSLSATAPLSYNNTTGAFGITQASGSQNGYLSSADWNTFNNKTGNTGTVTSVSGTGSVSGLTLSGTVTVNQGCTTGGAYFTAKIPTDGAMHILVGVTIQSGMYIAVVFGN